MSRLSLYDIYEYFNEFAETEGTHNFSRIYVASYEFCRLCLQIGNVNLFKNGCCEKCAKLCTNESEIYVTTKNRLSIKNLGYMELCLIKQVQPFGSFVFTNYSASFLKGQLILLPCDVDLRINTMLPVYSNTPLLIACSQETPNPSTTINYSVDLETVVETLQWLKANNCLYYDILINLESQSQATNENSFNSEMFANIHIWDTRLRIEAYPHLSELELLAPFRKLVTLTSRPSTFFDSDAEGLAYPHLFPYGKFYFRNIKEIFPEITPKNYIKALLRSKNSQFQTDASWIAFMLLAVQKEDFFKKLNFLLTKIQFKI